MRCGSYKAKNYKKILEIHVVARSHPRRVDLLWKIRRVSGIGFFSTKLYLPKRKIELRVRKKPQQQNGLSYDRNKNGITSRQSWRAGAHLYKRGVTLNRLSIQCLWKATGKAISRVIRELKNRSLARGQRLKTDFSNFATSPARPRYTAIASLRSSRTIYTCIYTYIVAVSRRESQEITQRTRPNEHRHADRNELICDYSPRRALISLALVLGCNAHIYISLFPERVCLCVGENQLQ